MSKVSVVIQDGRGGDRMGEERGSSRKATRQGRGKMLVAVLAEKCRTHSLTAEIHKQL